MSVFKCISHSGRTICGGDNLAQVVHKASQSILANEKFGDYVVWRFENGQTFAEVVITRSPRNSFNTEVKYLS